MSSSNYDASLKNLKANEEDAKRMAMKMERVLRYIQEGEEEAVDVDSETALLTKAVHTLYKKNDNDFFENLG